MALIKLGALAQDARGSLAGQVFSRNRGGAYVRQKVSPVQPVSNWSSITREIFRAVSQRWSCVLTPQQRAAWEAFALIHPFQNVFGDSITLPGIAFYQAVNARIADVQEDWIDNPPDTYTCEDLGQCSIAATVTTHVLTAAITIGRVLTSDEGLLVYATIPMQGGRNFQYSDYRLANLANRTLIQTATALGPILQNRFPLQVYEVGQTFGAALLAINKETGATSAATRFAVTIAAP